MRTHTERDYLAHAHSDVVIPGRLRDVVARARLLGTTGTESGTAIAMIENFIWADGALPADRPSQRRAWDIAHRRAIHAYHSGTALAVQRIARGAVAEFRGNAYRAFYATAWRAAAFAYSDADIVSAVSDALYALGMPLQSTGSSSEYPVTRARAAFSRNDRRELASFNQASRGTVH
jgi:hypothetical protein